MAKKGGAPTKSKSSLRFPRTRVSRASRLARFSIRSALVIKKSLRGGGLFTVPGLMKLKVVKKPATKAREGVNPFTGER